MSKAYDSGLGNGRTQNCIDKIASDCGHRNTQGTHKQLKTLKRQRISSIWTRNGIFQMDSELIYKLQEARRICVL
jgi:hypothetical protein